MLPKICYLQKGQFKPKLFFPVKHMKSHKRNFLWKGLWPNHAAANPALSNLSEVSEEVSSDLRSWDGFGKPGPSSLKTQIYSLAFSGLYPYRKHQHNFFKGGPICTAHEERTLRHKEEGQMEVYFIVLPPISGGGGRQSSALFELQLLP